MTTTGVFLASSLATACAVDLSCLANYQLRSRTQTCVSSIEIVIEASKIVHRTVSSSESPILSAYVEELLPIT